MTSPNVHGTVQNIIDILGTDISAQVLTFLGRDSSQTKKLSGIKPHLGSPTSAYLLRTQ